MEDFGKGESEQELLNRSHWRGLFMGFVAKAKSDNAPPADYVLRVDDLTVTEGKWKSWNFSATVTPVFKFKNTNLPENLHLVINQSGLPVASGAAKARWSGEFAEIDRVEYRPNKSLGIDEQMIAEIANDIGKYTERPDEY